MMQKDLNTPSMAKCKCLVQTNEIIFYCNHNNNIRHRLNLNTKIHFRAPLEMQMVHVEDRYIGKMGEVNWKAAQGAQHGVAILSICFYVDNTKPQVRFEIL